MRSPVVSLLLLSSLGLSACELIADFDRGKLDATVPQQDANISEVPSEPEPDDAGPSDNDAGPTM
jgi:hypothetical protein